MSTRRSGPGTVAVLLGALLTAGCLPGGDHAPAQTTRLTVSAATATGTTPDQAAMDSAREVVERRLTGAGYTSVKVAVPAPGQLSVSLAGRHDADELVGYLAPGHLTIRLVLDAAQQASDPATSAAATPGATAATADLATLSARQQFDRPDVTCAALNARDAAAGFDPKTAMTACDRDGTVKYLLDSAAVRGADVAAATAAADARSGTWDVTVHFAADGQKRWTELTRTAVTNAHNICGPSSVNDGHCAVAVVVDSVVVSAPTVVSVIEGDAMINSGGIDRAAAQQLASMLPSGRVPLTMKITSSEISNR